MHLEVPVSSSVKFALLFNDLPNELQDKILERLILDDVILCIDTIANGQESPMEDLQTFYRENLVSIRIARVSQDWASRVSRACDRMQTPCEYDTLFRSAIIWICSPKEMRGENITTMINSNLYWLSAVALAVAPGETMVSYKTRYIPNQAHPQSRVIERDSDSGRHYARFALVQTQLVRVIRLRQQMDVADPEST